MFSRFKTFITTTTSPLITRNEDSPVSGSPVDSPIPVPHASPKPVTSVKPAPTPSEVPLKLWKMNIISNTGQPIIRRYENIWNMCHENNIDLGRAAERTDRTLRTAISSANKHHKALRELEKSLKTLPAFLDKISTAVKQVESLKNRLDLLETAFESVAKEKAANSIKLFRKQLSDSISDHEKSKAKQLQQIEYKLRIEKQRADRDEEIQQNLKRLEAERKSQKEKEEQEREYLKQQQQLHDAFQKELEEFKETGEIGKSKEIDDVSTLETFDLEVDNSELNSFFDEEEEENLPTGIDPSLIDSDDDTAEQIEILPVIEDPSEG